MESKPLQSPPAPLLSEFPVKAEPTFSYVGLNFAGPLYIRNSSSNIYIQKIWICLFTCCVLRALHLELVPSLTAAALLRCLQRFIARRGTPKLIVSDNAKTFTAAVKEITSLYKNHRVFKYLSQRQLHWTFNLAKAAWWGRMFETLVESVKRCLRKTIIMK